MPYFSLRTLWRILPVGIFGISSSLMKVMFFGTLKPAIVPLQKSGINVGLHYTTVGRII